MWTLADRPQCAVIPINRRLNKNAPAAARATGPARQTVGCGSRQSPLITCHVRGACVNQNRVGAAGRRGGRATVRFTVSIEVTSFVPGARVEQLIDCADQLLYAAKTGGRNQVRVDTLGRPAVRGAAAATA